MRGLFRKQRKKEEGSVKSERGVYRPRFRSKGGVSRIIRDNYGPAQSYYSVIKEVLERDSYCCQHSLSSGIKCSSKKNVQVHHIRPLRAGGTTTKPNLLTLCGDHHDSRHPHLAMQN